MTREAVNEITLHGIRWADNIIVELVCNHGHRLPVAVRNHLQDALQCLFEAQQEMREQCPKSP